MADRSTPKINRPATAQGGMSTAWRDYALHLRAILEQVGVPHPDCLPGEPHACGQDYAAHCVNYLASLVAKAENGLWHTHHGDPAGQRLADHLVEHWRGILGGHGCSSCGEGRQS